MTDVFHALAYTGAAYVLLTTVGNLVCRGLFTLTGLKTGSSDSSDPDPRAGRVIGALERVILAVGIVMQSWEVLAAVIALKSVARFKELDNKTFAEYFLVGSLFSLLWAVAVTSAWIAYDKAYGIDLRATLADAVAATDDKTADE